MFERIRVPGTKVSRREFERSVLAFLPDLYRSARALVGQRADAEDLVHDACLNAFAAFDSARLDNEAACRAWLHQILINGFRDLYRRERRSPVRAIDEGGDPSRDAGDRTVIELAVSAEPQPDEGAAEAEFAVAVDAAFDGLPPDVRATAVLHIVSGLAYKEIAKLTDAPIGTVMSRIARARRILRSALSEHIPDGTSDATDRRGKSLPQRTRAKQG